jgi:hypothetical protein
MLDVVAQSGSSASAREAVMGRVFGSWGSRGRISGEDEAAVAAYFEPDLTFQASGGRESDYEGLKEYFSALRAAFDDRTIKRSRATTWSSVCLRPLRGPWSSASAYAPAFPAGASWT